MRRRLGYGNPWFTRITRRRLAVLCLSLLLVLQTGCYHYRVYGEQVPVGSEAKQETLWSSIWGTRQSQSSRPSPLGIQHTQAIWPYLGYTADAIWAKFQAMAEGARLATQQLWGRS